MPLRAQVDFQDRLVLVRVDRAPDGALRLRLTRAPAQVVLHLSYPSLEALWFELTAVLAEIRRC